jgi:subtilase family serine protease
VQPTYRVAYGTAMRATIDPDNFSSGFATWSGTSFAAPVLAGEIADQLFNGKHGEFDPIDAKRAVARGWSACTGATGMKRR